VGLLHPEGASGSLAALKQSSIPLSETEIEIAESETSDKFYFPRNIEKSLPFKPF
jgi:hypothetical protein